MPLTSLTLRDSQALQDCLVRDPSHVTQGAKGPHVRLIQKCLTLLEPTPISSVELQAALYGPTTAAAVLAYKKKRSIINASYQKTADDIVGKMTIARLDDEIKGFEQARTNQVRCEHGRGGHIRPFLAERVSATTQGHSLVAAPDPATNHTQLSIHLQHTDSPEWLTAGFFVNNLLARARTLLRTIGMTLSEPTLFESNAIPWPEPSVKTQFPVDIFALRKMAASLQPGASNVLRIIFCPFDEIDGIRGITDGGVGAIEEVQKFCLINLRLDRRNPDGGTLLHEMVHAAFPGKSPDHDGDARSIFSVSENRTLVRPEHATLLAKSFFARKLR